MAFVTADMIRGNTDTIILRFLNEGDTYGYELNRRIRQLTEETFHAVGESYYENNIRKLAYPNPKWARPAATVVEEGDAGKRIFKYYYGNKPVELKPENNPHDKNAVAVYIAGELVGYISREENLHVRDILKHREVVSISGFIGGGDYKVVSETFDTISGELGFSVTVRIKYI